MKHEYSETPIHIATVELFKARDRLCQEPEYPQSENQGEVLNRSSDAKEMAYWNRVLDSEGSHRGGWLVGYIYKT